MSDDFWPGTPYLRSVYKSLPADQHLELPSHELRPCPDCGQRFDAYDWRRHRGVSTDERCPVYEPRVDPRIAVVHEALSTSPAGCLHPRYYGEPSCEVVVAALVISEFVEEREEERGRGSRQEEA